MMVKQFFSVTLVVTTLALSSLISAEEDRSAVLERIKPIGTVTVAGMTPAQPAQKEPMEATAVAPVSEAVEASVDTVTAVVEKVATVAETMVADSSEKGKSVYSTACFACHGTGAAGAPKLGDNAAWAARIAQGKGVLLNHALNGKGAMPPKGGRMDLSDDDISAAIDYMIGQLP